jgi:four helix bundle protein
VLVEKGGPVKTLYRESLDLASDARGAIESILRRDAELGRRLKRACGSICEHVEEGMCLTGRARRREYQAASASAREALACVRAAASNAYLRDRDHELELEGRLTALAGRIERDQMRAAA